MSADVRCPARLSFQQDGQTSVFLPCYTKTMQKIATRVFIGASITFGVLGIFMVITGTDPDENSHGLDLVITKLFMVSVFVILTSFALSVAGKYLNGKS
jgi:hypothetical protein